MTEYYVIDCMYKLLTDRNGACRKVLYEFIGEIVSTLPYNFTSAYYKSIGVNPS